MPEVKTWSYGMLDRYMQTTVEGFTLEQKAHIAWFLSVMVEAEMREREMTMLQGDNMEPSDDDTPVDN